VETNVVLDALGDPTRRAICERLAGGPLAVVELAGDLPVSRPAVSQHLKVLKDAGLVIARPDGNRRLYELDPAGAAGVRRWLDRVWSDALSAFKVAAEQAAEQPVQEET
jgi:DNA-binding transcriptional ArsR family regulator